MSGESLGMLSVELQATLAEYIKQMTEAAKATKQFSDVVDKELQKVGVSLGKTEDKAKSFLETHQAGFRKAGLVVTAFGAAVLTAASLAVRAYSQMGEDLENMSKRTGVAASALSGLGYAAKVSGIELGNVEVAIKLMQKKFGDMPDSAGTAGKALADVADAAQKTAERAKEVADAQRDSAETITESAKDVSRAARDEAEGITKSAEDVARAKKDEAQEIKDSTRRVEDAVKDRVRTVEDAAKDEIRAARDLADTLKDIEDSRISATERATKSQRRIAESMSDANSRRVREERDAAESIADLREREAERIQAADKNVWKKQQEIRTKGATPENLNALKEAEAERLDVISKSQKEITRKERDTKEQLGDLAKSTARATRDANEERKQSGVDLAKTLADLEENKAKATERYSDIKIAASERVKAAELKVAEVTEQASARMATAAQHTADVMESAELRKRAAAEKTADTIEATEKRKRDAQEKVAAIIAKPIETKGQTIGPAGAVDESGAGGPPAVETLQKLGIAVKDFIGKNPYEQFNMLALAIAKIEDPTKRAKMAMEAFGARSGTQILPMIEILAEAEKRARALGYAMSEEDVKAAAAFHKSLEELNMGLIGIRNTIAAQLLPILKPLVDKILEIIVVVVAWMKAHPGLTKAIGELTIGVGALALALGPILLGLAALPLIIAGWAVVGPVIAAVGGFFAGFLIPLAAVVAAIVGLALLAKYVINNWEPIKAFFGSLWSDLKTGWANLGDGVLAIWTGIVKGIKAAINAVSNAINQMLFGFYKALYSIINGLNSIPGAKIPYPAAAYIPMLHTGGMFRAETAGGQGLAMLQDGEQVIPAGSVNRSTSENRMVTIEVNNPLSAVDKAMLIRETKRSIAIDSYVHKGLQGA